ncbi:MAG: hypothetical protein JO281_00645 [Pseudonocardiales bacterium]|nr:hypothetical protein [Pseudonocardiales bacterium]
MNGNKDRTSFSPDGLTEQIINVLLSEVDVAAVAKPRLTSALTEGTVTQRRYRRQRRRPVTTVVCALPLRVTASDPADSLHLGRRAGHGGWSSGGMSFADVHGTRPGSPNRQERAHQVGAPESLTDAIKEIGMLQVHTCVSVHCAQCGDSPSSLDFEARWPTEDDVLNAAAAQGWRVGPGGRLWCSACAPVLMCEAEGHEFSGWRRPVTRDGRLAGSEYRHCLRCCLHDSRPATWLSSAGSGPGKSVVLPFALLAGASAGEVA